MFNFLASAAMYLLFVIFGVMCVVVITVSQIQFS